MKYSHQTEAKVNSNEPSNSFEPQTQVDVEKSHAFHLKIFQCTSFKYVNVVVA